jgi:hypothetical protein
VTQRHVKLEVPALIVEPEHVGRVGAGALVIGQGSFVEAATGERSKRNREARPWRETTRRRAGSGDVRSPARPSP